MNLNELKKQRIALDAAIRNAEEEERKAKEEAKRAKAAQKMGITTLKPVIYKGEELEQLTDGAADYTLYRRSGTMVPYFVFRHDGTLITSCAFKCAGLAVCQELNTLAAAAKVAAVA